MVEYNGRTRTKADGLSSHFERLIDTVFQTVDYKHRSMAPISEEVLIILGQAMPWQAHCA